MTDIHPTMADVTDRIRDRSRESRSTYLDRVDRAAGEGPNRLHLACTNLAHGFAACGADDKAELGGGDGPNIGIVTSYNDMLSAHELLGAFPQIIKRACREAGAVAQVAGGVPAMCDGVTQGRPGMELSLFSRDVIAMATGIALSHAMFDGALCLGVCDKIVPGLFIGAAAFGHLPVIFVPGGPMPSGLPNAEKARIRQLHANGEVGDDALLESESASYHAPGTCTFYGTANSNQMMMEVMGLHLPGAAFVNPNTPLRDALTAAAASRITEMTALGNDYRPVGRMIDERSIINAVVGLLATGGSTNHTLHLVAMARAVGVAITWDDFAELSPAVPLLTRIYPNGPADVNHFHAAGGMGFLIRELLGAGLLHEDIGTVAGNGLAAYGEAPELTDGDVRWRPAPAESADSEVLRPFAEPFSPNGGLRVLDGNLGRAVIKVSAVKAEHRVVEAPAAVFTSQDALGDAFKRGELHRDVVAVVRFQGPRANGMPELHELTPKLAVLQDLGYRVALVTDGRMSGASGKVPAAIHVTPECAAGGPLARVQDGDIIRLDAEAGLLEAVVPADDWSARAPATADLSDNAFGTGRELFAGFRIAAMDADAGAGVL